MFDRLRQKVNTGPLAFLSGFADRRCTCCQEPVQAEGAASHRLGGMIFCAFCQSAFEFGVSGYCKFCALPFPPGSLSQGPCQHCLHTLPPWGEIFFLGRYEGRLRDCLLALKFENKLPVAKMLGSLLALKIQARLNGVSIKNYYSAIVPVPLHPSRLLERGYNQSLELARFVGKGLNLPVRQELLKIKATAPQEKLTREARLQAVQGAFEASRHLGGQRLLLLDDVMTTGATVCECANSLLRAKAAAVDVAIFGRTAFGPA